MLTWLVIGVGVAGWVVLAGVFVATGAALLPVARWAQHSRPAEVVAAVA